MTSQNDLAIIKSYFVTMMFYPRAWQSAQNSNRDWTKTAFPPVTRNSIPAMPGVYAFVIIPPNLFDFEWSNGLFYVGNTANLSQRISAYIGELNKEFNRSARPHIWWMLHQWKGYISFFFTTTNNKAEAEALEAEMLKAFRPPFNKEYDAETNQIMRAFP